MTGAELVSTAWISRFAVAASWAADQEHAPSRADAEVTSIRSFEVTIMTSVGLLRYCTDGLLISIEPPRHVFFARVRKPLRHEQWTESLDGARPRGSPACMRRP